MKLSAAALALAGAALLSDNTASATSAGQCLSAVSAYAQSGQVETDGIEWNDQAAYYHIAFEAEAAEDEEADAEEEQAAEETEEEQAAEEAEATIFDSMQGLADALQIDLEEYQAEQEANAEAQQYQGQIGRASCRER